ncbi:hypothetical protein A9P82_04220 [Arachidicoccus ginsenosidimutans]|uniref:hypothetical protein n=1 Tax=Arachidicoccus sp. BS20 TaxID=1850526 RepID=UPI0007F0D430|nr:hypothetical protein [Arachidicoccus sp. BS20]ANI88569.1 hypothetical protein A9P82_04220 [Arachidicoccus sp. BS20]
MKSCLFIIIFCCIACGIRAQVVVHGHVYGGVNKNSPIDSIQVSTSSGNVTYTDIHGIYMIAAKQANDTLHISFQGREIIRYPVSFITNTDKFDIYLNNPGFYDSTYANELPQVQVRARNYHNDSLLNREKYAGVFDYTKPKFNPMSPITSVVNLFNKPYQHRQQRYRKFAETSEKAGYVNSRWTRSLVAKYTGIQDDDELTKFMKAYEPTYDTLVIMNELDLDQYIVDSYKKYKEKQEKK